MKYIYIKILHSLIFSSCITTLLYLNHEYFAIGVSLFAVLTYPLKNDFKNVNDEEYKKNFKDIDAVLKDHERALTEIINRIKS